MTTDYEPGTFQMKKPPSRAPWIVTTFLLLLGAGGAGYLAFMEKQKGAEATGKIALLQDREADLKKKLEAAESERAALAAEKQELSKDIQSKDEELNKLKGTYDQLQARLKTEVSAGEIQLMQEGSKLRVGLVDKILFGSGDATISKRGQDVLLKVGQILASIEDRQIQVSGHTDNTPIASSKVKEFPTNWELSTARALNVVRFLQDQAKVPPERLTVGGYSEYHPVASNKTPQGRARNRRIEILLTPLLAPKTVSKKALAEKTEKPPEKTPEKTPKAGKKR